MSDVLLRPWKRYGHDRVYLETADGRRLGYWDHKTRTASLDDVSDADLFYGALRDQLDILPATVGGTTVVKDQEATNHGRLPPPPPAGKAEPDTPWRDLAPTRAGSALREQATQARQAAPVRTLLARVLGVHTDERAWRIGADGEEVVAKQLSTLASTWRVLHSVPVGTGNSDIDHVVIGPGGVYTLNTKHLPDARVTVAGSVFYVNGHRVKYVRNSRFEAERASRLLTAATGLPVAVTGLIVVYGAAGGLTVEQQPPGGAVVVVSRREVASWLERRPETLTPAQVGALYEQARRSTTWQPPSTALRARR
jgi:hypothetical protein